VDAAAASSMKMRQVQEQSMKSSGEHLVRLFTMFVPGAERTYQTRTSTKRRKKMPDINHNEMIVNDIGICKKLYIDDRISLNEIVISKEAFIEAYNRYIKEEENESDN
jgi:hypothetical protein